MTAIDYRNLVAALAALVASGVCLAYVLTNQRRKAKKPVYAWAASVFLYLGGVYVAAMITDAYLIRSGWMGVLGLILLVFAFIANVFADWRRV